jgi:transposase-like protein
MSKRSNKFSDEVRQAIVDSGLSRYRIAKTLGVSESLLSRFMAGGWLGQESMDALAKLLDLHVTAAKRSKEKE